MSLMYCLICIYNKNMGVDMGNNVLKGSKIFFLEKIVFKYLKNL